MEIQQETNHTTQGELQGFCGKFIDKLSQLYPKKRDPNVVDTLVLQEGICHAKTLLQQSFEFAINPPHTLFPLAQST